MNTDADSLTMVCGCEGELNRRVAEGAESEAPTPDPSPNSVGGEMR
jgi:hypothetical protein